jgi:hypothetical protein
VSDDIVVRIVSAIIVFGVAILWARAPLPRWAVLTRAWRENRTQVEDALRATLAYPTLEEAG